MSKYVLPDLSYDYGALEPNISGKIMELHHDKHHLAYVNGANSALDALADAREKNDLTMVNKFQKDLAFNLAGHVNHTVFWKNMSPEGGDKPTGELAAAIDEYFGSFDAFRAHFTASALGIQGSGWSILVWDILGQKLIIEQLYDHQGNLSVGSIPLLMLDMWEHAFYLDYQNVKPEYVKAFWNIVNWADVQARFLEASQNTSTLLLP
ncbi:MAG: superoxide dismutase [Rhodoluna sp.]|jgi:Fe-Mn family superoxide dismutase|nr:superoxide dismutase [Rhodoluna sp.]